MANGNFAALGLWKLKEWENRKRQAKTNNTESRAQRNLGVQERREQRIITSEIITSESERKQHKMRYSLKIFMISICNSSGSCNLCVSITHLSIVPLYYIERMQRGWQNYWIIMPDITPVVKIYTKIIENERMTLNLMTDLLTLTVLWSKF